ncbi:uncharacterized protein LAJ45_04276 [Morchella importuna]|uniref:uncharacterized protein n=1 Tax=Morchella importuna TaxID=1174673 RepID=UPI001E8CCE01|nr:uncharacterized protein LAJ45_04276 [Morchella importuna]KAH8151654.1 hypothetical protein LAJ45_04276 [Morchella importuna]
MNHFRASPPPSRSFTPHIGMPRHGRQDSRSSLRLPPFFKRLFKFPQMDFEMATWEMTNLIIAPKKVFKSIYHHFLVTSLLFATAGYFLAGKFLKVQGAGGLGRGGIVGGEGEIEFMYCFEIGVRAFFPVWVFLYVIQFLMMPILTRDYWISTFLGNSLYLIAVSYYCVITFMGYNALPFLHHTEIMLGPIFIFVVLWVVSLFGFNLPKHIIPVLLGV